MNYSPIEIRVIQEKVQRVYSTELGEEIHGEADIYYPLFEHLEEAGEDDVIVLNMGGHGGSVLMMKRIINEIKGSDATVCAHVITDVASAHAMIAISCDYMEVEPGATFMFHSCQGGLKDSFAGIQNYTDSVVKYEREYFKQLSEGIITPREFNKMWKSGEDLYFPGSVIQERFNKRQKTLAEEEEQEEDIESQILNAMSTALTKGEQDGSTQ